MVGATGFEPATTCTPSKCATRLRYAPARSRRSGSPARRGRGKYHPPCRASTRPVERLRGVRLGGVVEGVLQHLRRPERQHAARADLDLLAGLRIAADARLLLADDEVPEAGKLDLFAALERVLDGVEHHLDDLGGLLLGETGFFANALDDVGLGHDGCHSSRRDEGRARRPTSPFARHRAGLRHRVRGPTTSPPPSHQFNATGQTESSIKRGFPLLDALSGGPSPPYRARRLPRRSAYGR